MPLLEEAHGERPDDFDVLAVSYDDLEGDSRAFVERLGVTYPVAARPDDMVKDSYGVRGIPQTFFVDADGVVQRPRLRHHVPRRPRRPPEPTPRRS